MRHYEAEAVIRTAYPFHIPFNYKSDSRDHHVRRWCEQEFGWSGLEINITGQHAEYVPRIDRSWALMWGWYFRAPAQAAYFALRWRGLDYASTLMSRP